MLNIKYPIILLFVLGFFACNPLTENKKNDEDSLQYYPITPKEITKAEFRYYYRSVQSFYDTFLSKSGFSGGFLVAKNGVIIFEKYAGFADVQTQDSMKANSSLHIASTSKPFTSMAILQLAKNNKLNIGDPVVTYLKDFPYPDISIKMLLNHRSGLANYLYFIDPKKFPSDYKLTNKDVLDYLIVHKTPLNYKPDTRFNYCNTNYVLLALIIEKVSGELYPVFLHKNFFVPLEMEDSYVYTATDTTIQTNSFYSNGKLWSLDIFDGTYGDKNIYTTARDILKWSVAISNKKTFSSSMIDSAFTSYSNERPSQHNYGLGWRILQLPNGKKIIYHHGRWHGSNSFFAMLPDENVCIIIMGNKLNRNIYKGNLLYDVFGNYYQNRTDSGYTTTDSMDPGSPR